MAGFFFYTSYMGKIKIGVVTGSLRKGAFSRKVARSVSACMPDTLEMVPVEIGVLGLYNQDFDDEGRTPPEWTAFRRRLAEMNGFLFITPEYNRSMPPVLKNALDIGSRPYGANRWDGKPGAIISVSPGKLGGFGAYHALRQVLGFLNVPLLQQPEMYLGGAAELFNEKDELAHPATRQFLQDFAGAFAAWTLRMQKS